MKIPRPTSILRTLAFATAILSLGTSAQAVDFNWTNGAGDNDWFNGLNWDTGTVPTGGAGNFVRFITGASGPATLNATPDPVQDYLFGDDGNNAAGTSRVLNQTGGDAVVTGWVRMGMTNTGTDGGTYNLSGGSITAGRFNLGEISGTTSTVGVSGTGIMRQADVADPGDTGTWSSIGQDGGSTGLVNLSGGGLMSFDSRTFVGRSGMGTVNQTGGTFEVRRGELAFGDGGGTGVYNISSGTLRTISDINDGDRGGNITLGQWDNSHGTLNVSGNAVVSASRSFNMADGRADDGGTPPIPTPSFGEVMQTGGAVSFAGTVQVDRGGVVGPEIFGGFNMSSSVSGTSIYTISSGTLRQNDVTNNDDGGSWNRIGDNGLATFNLSGDGAVSFDKRTHLGAGGTGNGTVNQTGGSFEVRSHDLIIGDTGTGHYNMSAGTLNVANTVSVANWNNSNGELNVSGTADVTVGGGLIIGQVENDANTSIGVVTQSGTSSVQIGGDINMGINGTLPSGTYNLQGGTLDMTGGNINKGPGVAAFNMTGGRLEDLANFNIGDFNQLGGVLAPGPTGSIGSTTINGAYSLDSTATIEISITGDTTSDQLFVNGGLTLGGGLLSIVDDPLGLTPGSSFLIVNNDLGDPVGGEFSNAPSSGIYVSPAGNPFTVSYTAGDGNDVSVTVVPEPATGALLLGSMGMFALLRRRRHA